MSNRKNLDLEWLYPNKEFVKNSSKNNEKLTEEEKSEMKKDAYEIPLFWNISFDEAVRCLLERKKEWGTCFINLNRKRLYSFDIENENDAYLQFYWRTKFQVEMEREKAHQEYEARKKREQLETIEKIPWWIEEGKKYINESKWSDWEKYVNSSARDIYYWRDIDLTLELLKLIDNWESWKTVQQAFDNQGHSNISYRIFRDRVVYFSKKWEVANQKLEENW